MAAANFGAQKTMSKILGSESESILGRRVSRETLFLECQVETRRPTREFTQKTTKVGKERGKNQVKVMSEQSFYCHTFPFRFLPRATTSPTLAQSALSDDFPFQMPLQNARICAHGGNN